MRDFYPHTVFVERQASGDALTKRVLARLPKADVIEIDDDRDPISVLKHPAVTSGGEDRIQRFSLGKRVLLLKRHKGEWLKGCPGTSGHVCCNLWVVNPGEGCPLDCTYCYLQSYLKRNPTLKLFTNLEDLQDAISEKLASAPSRLFRIGTGEVIDSLVWDELTDMSSYLVPLFGSFDNGVLELKTKTNFVNNLVSLKNEHNGNTVVSWSVNARPITESDEASTASLDERIEAMGKVIDAGYRVGIHFDPLIHFEGWQDAYREAVSAIFSKIDVKRVGWISVSTLRYKKEMQDVMLERFPDSGVPFGEQILAKDGKLRYIQPLRLKMIDFVWNEIKSRAPQAPVYMCMESSAAWRTIAGGSPVAGSELVEIFSRKRKNAIEIQQ